MDAGRLTCEWRQEGGAAVLEVGGEVDLATAGSLREALERSGDGGDGNDVVVDLRHVTFLDSTGLTTLIVAHRAATAAGAVFALVCSPGPVRRVLQVSGFDRVVPVHETLEEALA